MFFYDHNLWETTLKLRSRVENPGSMSRQYVEALGVALTLELVRINSDTSLRRPVHRGGLAVWQQKAGGPPISMSMLPTRSHSRPSPSWHGRVIPFLTVV
jgi:hypothetical protein